MSETAEGEYVSMPVPKKKRRPTKALPAPETVEAAAKSPYPKNVRYYVYKPKDGSDSILLAMNGFEAPDKLWYFDLAQLPRLAQTWRWMEHANVPKDIQRRAQMLPDPEYFGMLNEWLAAIQALQGGGPQGAINSGK